MSDAVAFPGKIGMAVTIAPVMPQVINSTQQFPEVFLDLCLE